MNRLQQDVACLRQALCLVTLPRRDGLVVCMEDPDYPYHSGVERCRSTHNRSGAP